MVIKKDQRPPLTPLSEDLSGPLSGPECTPL